MPNAVCIATLIAFLLAGCVLKSGEESGGRRIEVTSAANRQAPLVCLEPHHTSAPANWRQPDHGALLSPPPFNPLYYGGFLSCRALQEGIISPQDNREAGLDQAAAVLRAQAAAGLMRIGVRDNETIADLHAWHLSSPFLNVGCQAAIGLAALEAERISPDIFPYCRVLNIAAMTSDNLP